MLPNPIPPVLSDFNEEEYLKEPTDEDLEKSPKVAGNLRQDAVEANMDAEDGSNAN